MSRRQGPEFVGTASLPLPGSGKSTVIRRSSRQASPRSSRPSLSPRPPRSPRASHAATAQEAAPSRRVLSKAAVENGEVIIEGWLAKRGPTESYAFQRRWCTLWTTVLVLYTAEDRKVKKGEVPIMVTSKVFAFTDSDAPADSKRHQAKHPFGFVIDVDPSAPALRRYFYFETADAYALDDWKMAVELAASTLKLREKAATQRTTRCDSLLGEDETEGSEVTSPGMGPTITLGGTPVREASGTPAKRNASAAQSRLSPLSEDKEILEGFHSSDSDDCERSSPSSAASLKCLAPTKPSQKRHTNIDASTPMRGGLTLRASVPNMASTMQHAPSEKSRHELQMGDKSRGVNVCKVLKIGLHSLCISKGSVIEFKGDAIVNAAGTAGMSGGGVDGTLMHAAGPEVNAERLALPEIRKGVRIPVGDARVTSAGKLNAKCIIHAVGPHYKGTPTSFDKKADASSCNDNWPLKDQKLRSAYEASMRLAREHDCNVVGLAPLSAGVFRGERGLDAVLTIGVEAVRACLEVESSTMEVHFVAYSSQELSLLLAAAARIRPATQVR